MCYNTISQFAISLPLTRTVFEYPCEPAIKCFFLSFTMPSRAQNCYSWCYMSGSVHLGRYHFGGATGHRENSV